VSRNCISCPLWLPISKKPHELRCWIWISIRHYRIDSKCFNSFMFCDEMKKLFAIKVTRIQQKLPFVLFAIWGAIFSWQKSFIHHVKKSPPFNKSPSQGRISHGQTMEGRFSHRRLSWINRWEAIFSQTAIVNKSPPLLGAIFSRGRKSHVTLVRVTIKSLQLSHHKLNSCVYTCRFRIRYFN